MSHRSLSLLLVGGSALLASPAHADQAACQAVEDALVKMATTPVHETITVERAPTVLKSEAVRTMDTMYVEVRGSWSSKPYDPKAEVTSVRTKMKQELKECSRERSEAAEGEAADLYHVHATSGASTTDMQIWISTAKGLPLKVVSVQSGGKMKSEVRMDYANVAPPAGATR